MKISEQSSPVKLQSEYDFASLDRLQREKPNANTVTSEGNSTLQWLKTLSDDKKSNVIEKVHPRPRLSVCTGKEICNKAAMASHSTTASAEKLQMS